MLTYFQSPWYCVGRLHSPAAICPLFHIDTISWHPGITRSSNKPYCPISNLLKIFTSCSDLQFTRITHHSRPVYWMEFARQVSAIAALTSFQYMDSSSLKKYKQINLMQYAHGFVVHYNAQNFLDLFLHCYHNARHIVNNVYAFAFFLTLILYVQVYILIQTVFVVFTISFWAKETCEHVSMLWQQGNDIQERIASWIKTWFRNNALWISTTHFATPVVAFEVRDLFPWEMLTKLWYHVF